MGRIHKLLGIEFINVCVYIEYLSTVQPLLVIILFTILTRAPDIFNPCAVAFCIVVSHCCFTEAEIVDGQVYVVVWHTEVVFCGACLELLE